VRILDRRGVNSRLRWGEWRPSMTRRSPRTPRSRSDGTPTHPGRWAGDPDMSARRPDKRSDPHGPHRRVGHRSDPLRYPRSRGHPTSAGPEAGAAARAPLRRVDAGRPGGRAERAADALTLACLLGAMVGMCVLGLILCGWWPLPWTRGTPAAGGDRGGLDLQGDRPLRTRSAGRNVRVGFSRRRLRGGPAHRSAGQL